jgi:ABC-type bacteriocin/lantibiotic exporter with double-glycine peptidase domain
VLVLLVLSLAFKALTTYVQTHFALMREYSIGKRLVEGYLHQPYSWFLNRHSADLGKTILSEVQTVIYNGILPLMTLLAQSAVTIALLCLLLLVDPILAVSAGLVLGIAYGGILVLVSGWLSKLGQERIQANQERYTVLSEAFGALPSLPKLMLKVKPPLKSSPKCPVLRWRPLLLGVCYWLYYM